MPLQDKIDRRKFVVTMEIQPSVDDEMYQLLDSLNCIKGRVDCLNVSEMKKPTWDADPLLTGKALVDENFDTIFQTTTRRKHRPDLEADLIKANQVGIENILVFSEDYTLTGTSSEEKMFFHVDSAKIFSVLESLKQGTDIKGRELPNRMNFFVGSGVDSGKGEKTPTQELKQMEQMMEQGTRFFQTAPIFDLDAFKDFMRIVEPFGVAILAGVVLLRTGGMARYIKKHLGYDVPDWIIEKMERSPDKLKASIEIFTHLVTGLRDICQGIHIIPLGWYAKLPRFLDEAKIF